MAQARGRDSHAGGGMLDYSIRGPLAPSMSPGFYGWIGRGGAVEHLINIDTCTCMSNGWRSGIYCLGFIEDQTFQVLSPPLLLVIQIFMLSCCRSCLWYNQPKI
jgi:hypothetical protein